MRLSNIIGILQRENCDLLALKKFSGAPLPKKNPGFAPGLGLYFHSLFFALFTSKQTGEAKAKETRLVQLIYTARALAKN